MLSSTFLVLMLVVVLVGDTMAFNQLATQSATDAILPILVLSVGVTFALEAVRRIVCRRDRADVAIAVASGIVSGLGWIAWTAYWPLAGAAWIVIAAAALGGVATNVRPLVPTAHPRQDLGGAVAVLGLLQTIVLTYFAVLALVDAPTGPFG